MIFDTRIAVLVRDDLLTWQKLNVTAFTVSGIATLPDVIGEPYVDASDRTYLPMIKQPIMVFSATTAELRDVYAVPSAELRLVGLALRGRKKPMEKLLKGLSLHR